VKVFDADLIVDMEQQVEILQLENSLSSARHRLGEMRKLAYQEED
jgi:hypothetical protein